MPQEKYGKSSTMSTFVSVNCRAKVAGTPVHYIDLNGCSQTKKAPYPEMPFRATLRSFLHQSLLPEFFRFYSL